MAKKNAKQKADAKSRSRQKKTNVRGQSEVFRIVEEEIIVKTSRGIEVVCLGIAAMISEQKEMIHASFDWPDIPTRIMEDAAGVQIEEPLNRDYVEKYGTPEQKQVWAEYEAELASTTVEFNQVYNEKFTMLLAFKGICLKDPALIDQWREEHEQMGFVIPESPIDQAVYWFTTEIIGKADEDMYAISLGVYRASGAEEGPLDELEASFRANVGASDEGDEPGDDPEGAESQESG